MSDKFEELYALACRRAKRERDNRLLLNGINYRLTSAFLAIADGDILPDEMQEFARDTIREAEAERAKLKVQD